jgi:hypothetical protein
MLKQTASDCYFKEPAIFEYEWKAITKHKREKAIKQTM